MRKVMFLLVASLLMLSVTGCSSDDNSPTYSKKDIVGKWEHVSSKIFDTKKKFLGEGPSENPDGCGVLVLTFTDVIMEYHKYEGKDRDGNCKELNDNSRYTIKGNRIYEMDANGDLDEDEFMDIKSVNDNALVLFQKFKDPIIVNGVAIKYLEIYLRKIK